MEKARDLHVSDILENGYFAQSGDAFVFVDANTGQAVPNPSGTGPLQFKREDVLNAGAAADARRITRRQEIWMLPGGGPKRQ